MRKSIVTAVVTTLFVAYSFLQRTLGVQATGDLGPSSAATSANPVVPQASSGDSAPAPAPAASSPGPATSNPPRASGRSAPTPAPQPTPAPAKNPGSQYRDGTYTGAAADAFYGNIQVQATISNGKLTNIKFLQWPNDRSRSIRINQQALPWLTQEAIQAQSANVDVISGATDTSEAFGNSLQSALHQAQG